MRIGPPGSRRAGAHFSVVFNIVAAKVIMTLFAFNLVIFSPVIYLLLFAWLRLCLAACPAGPHQWAPAAVVLPT